MILLALAALSLSAPPKSIQGDLFRQQVKPLLEKRCLGCHGVGAKLGSLDLRTEAAALKGGIRGSAFKSGDPERSVALAMISGKRQPSMPPNNALKPDEIALLTRWVQSGEGYGSLALTQGAKQSWWSFVPPKLVSPPPVSKWATLANWDQSPIDRFLINKLRSKGLTPSPKASRRSLIRRAFFDLIGLPPTPEEVAAFEVDRRPDAWERVVDRLLASPRYGERWGRHWLDVVRYADSGGFEGDKDRPLMWRYRDYVIQSFNEDKPFNRFVQEQIAGDELWPTNRDAIIATGYLAGGCEDLAQAKDAKARADEIDDLIITTGQGVLGLTLGCARCHDHKFDPVSQADYYRFFALFAPTKRGEYGAPSESEVTLAKQANSEIELALYPLRLQFDPLDYRGRAEWVKRGVTTPSEDQIAAILPEADRNSFKSLAQQIATLEAKKLPVSKAYGVTDAGPSYPQVHIYRRGDAYQPTDPVEPGFIHALPNGDASIKSAEPTSSTTGRRRALAKWLTSSENPLTARVWVNRVWRQHFGKGLVNTPSNFGLNGETPSHPELLDWLALSFIKNGWRTKPIHRMILLSQAWQQSSAQRPEGMKLDPQNRLIWRMPVRRLEAEPIRDAILSISGSLNTEMGGPPVYPPVDASLRADTFQGVNWPEGEDSPKTWRRSVYVKVKRSLIFPQLDAFDCPEISASVGARNVTTTPSQALLLLNDPLIRRQSEQFSQRLTEECGKEWRKCVERAYWLAASRPPTPREAQLAVSYLQTHSLAEFCHAMLNLSELAYVD